MQIDRKGGLTMIRHIIFWSLSETGRKKNQQELLDAMRQSLGGMVGVVPGLLCAEIAPNAAPGCDYVFYAELTDAEALAAYQVHPLHLAHKERFREDFAARAVGDYEIVR